MQAAQIHEHPPFPLMKQGDLVSFYHLQMPRWLFHRRYRGISLEAKVAYTFLLNRFQLSRLNGWINPEGEVFVVFTREALAEELGVSLRKAVSCFRELASIGLIWERRMGRGYPNQIYLAQVAFSPEEAGEHDSAPFCPRSADSALLNSEEAVESQPISCGNDKESPQDPQDLHVKRCESCTSKSADSAPQDMQNLHPSKKEKSDTEMSDIEKEDLSADGEAELADLLGKCGLAHLPPDAAGMFRNAIERLWRAERFTLEGISLPREKIRADLRRLHSGILVSTLEKLRRNTARVHNSTAYVMAALLNNIWDYVSDNLLDPEANQFLRETEWIAAQMEREPC